MTLRSIRRRGSAVVAVAAIALGLGACARPGDGGYHLTADFSRAVALYAHSRVKVMGVDAGTVRHIDVAGDHIRVRMQIDRKVPLPADVQAMIVPLSLIGERNVVLFPPWQPGMPRARDGDVIPEARTRVPAEPDEALKAVTDLARAIAPNAVRRLVTGGAAALAGHGNDLNAAIAQAGTLTSTLAAQDQALISTAESLHTVAAGLNARTATVGALLDDFSKATGVLADERRSVGDFLSALVTLSDEGNALLSKYQDELPADVGHLRELAGALGANAGSVQQFVRALREIADGFVSAYHKDGGIYIRGGAGPDSQTALQPLYDLLGLGPVPCVPTQVTCK